ncbi:MAG TPA: type IX secretion system membrane protein PorP/SprF [Bacteroidales bacterium]|nr:type IX secretion system membrane protein PorP/SprF [Bacteroidales bacterium]
MAVILFMLFTVNLVSGQQLPIYSQYLYNKFLINPAVAGSDGYTSLNLTAREQWVGYAGAPRTFSVSWQTRMLKRGFKIRQTRSHREVFRPQTDGRVGFGGYIFSDRNGLIQRTGFQASYAYHTWIERSTQLSLGLAFTGYYYKIDEKQINFEDPNEPWLNNNLRRGVFVPDVAFGIYLLNARYSVGFSADQLSEASAKIGGPGYKNFTMSRQYYLFGSYDFSQGTNNIIQPAFLVKMSEQWKPQVDMGLTYFYNDGFWGGLAYRTSGALIANIGFKYQNIYFGYAFDYTLQEIQRITYGTHEITVAVKFGDSARKYRWLDRY